MNPVVGIIKPDGLKKFHVQNPFAKAIYNESLPYCG
jgi:hypothetical protein